MKTRGVIHTSGLIMIAVTALGIIVWTTITPSGAPAGGQGDGNGGGSPQLPAATLQVKLFLASAGLDHKALDAAGVSATQRSSVEDAAAQWLANPQHTLVQQQAEYRALQKSVAATLRSPAANAEARQAARASLANAKTTMDAQVSALFDHATSGLQPNQVSTLRHIQSLRWTGQPPSALATATDAKAAFAARDAAAGAASADH